MLSEILFMESIPVISLLDGFKKQILPTPKDSLVSPFPQVVLAAKVRLYREREAVHVGLVRAIAIDLLTCLVIGANYKPIFFSSF